MKLKTAFRRAINNGWKKPVHKSGSYYEKHKDEWWYKWEYFDEEEVKQRWSEWPLCFDHEQGYLPVLLDWTFWMALAGRSPEHQMHWEKFISLLNDRGFSIESAFDEATKNMRPLTKQESPDDPKK